MEGSMRVIQGPRPLERLSIVVTQATGTSWGFAAALLVVVGWLATGPLFRWSDTWQLVINTSTTIVTFLMVFLLQRAQNKESRAIHLKLNELVAAVEGASNRLLNVEDLSEQELRTLHEYYGELYRLAKKDQAITHSHSVEEARSRHGLEHGRRRNSGPPA